MPATVASELIDSGLAQQCLALASDTPGVLACSVTDYTRDHVIASMGDEPLIADASSDLVTLWRTYERLDSDEPLTELQLTCGPHVHIALPIARHPGALLIAVASSEHGDLALIRWQLSMARNHLN